MNAQQSVNSNSSQEAELIGKVQVRIWSFAKRVNLRIEDAEDMYQEALLAVIGVFRKYGGRLKPEELAKVSGTAAKHRIRSLQRAEVSRVSFMERLSGFSQSCRLPGPHDDAEYNESMRRLLEAQFSSLARRVLSERLEPSWSTVSAASSDFNKKGHRKDTGVYITGSHMSKALGGISPQSVSVGDKQIRDFMQVELGIAL